MTHWFVASFDIAPRIVIAIVIEREIKQRTKNEAKSDNVIRSIMKKTNISIEILGKWIIGPKLFLILGAPKIFPSIVYK